MDYVSHALEALGKALSDKDLEIQTLKWSNEDLRRKVKELEGQIKIETTVTTTVSAEREA